MFRSLVVVLASAFVLLIHQGVKAEVTKVLFFNLTGEPVYIASASFPTGDKRTHTKGGSQLAYYHVPSWRFSGWKRINPGQMATFSAGNYYVKQNGKRLSWPGLKEVSALISDGEFHAEVARGPKQSEAFAELYAKGYKNVRFQTFSKGHYTISGNNDRFELKIKSFKVDLRSKSPKLHNKDFLVQGKPLYYTENCSSLRAKGKKFTFGKNHLRLDVFTYGKKPNPFAGRNDGYYKGTVTVYSTTPK